MSFFNYLVGAVLEAPAVLESTTSSSVQPSGADHAAGLASLNSLNGLIQFVPFILLFVVFYFFLIRPQRKKQKEHEEKLSKMKDGDTVLVSGSFFAKVHKIETDHVEVLLLPSEVVVKVLKTAITDFING